MDAPQTKKYAFILGRERDLCFAELKSVLERFGFCSSEDESNFILSDNVAIINLDKDPAKLIDIFGGVTKIYEVFETGTVIPAQVFDCTQTMSDSRMAGIQNTRGMDPRVKPEDDNYFRRKIKDLILERSGKITGKFNFGFSAYGRHRAAQLNPLGLNIKKELKNQLSLRFIALKDKELSTIVSSKNKLATEGLEVGFFNDFVGKLIAVTDPEAWSERDYGKPRGDKFSGMLPPKLARAMINIALGAITNNQETNIKKNQNFNTQNSKKLEIRNLDLEIPQAVLVADPFCGSGNILLEALMLGLDVIGSDISKKAVADSRENIKWLLRSVIPAEAGIQARRGLDPRVKPEDDSYFIKIFQADATSSDLIRNLELEIRNYDDVVVVCEPYLGEPKKYVPSMNAARGEYSKIKELYLGFLKNMARLSDCPIVDGDSNRTMEQLNNSVVLCLVFPLVETTDGGRYSLYRETVDEIKKIGYTALQSPLVYGRDYQVVKREIVLLQL